MPVPFRLPIVNSDDGQWGDELRQWLMKQHTDNGSDDSVNNGNHQAVTILAGTTAVAPLTLNSGSLLTSSAAGSIEFLTDRLYFTQTTSTTRKVLAAFDDSSGATGDVYYRDSNGYFVRPGIGSGNQVLSVASGSTPGWNQPIFAIATKTGTTYTITNTDTVVIADASSNDVAITLPAASTVTGYRYYIKRKDSAAHNVTVGRSGSDTIDGATSQSLVLQYESITVVSDGTNWYII